MQTVYMASLGCAKNLVDSEVMLGSLLKEGYSSCSQPEEAGLIIVNTCSFIDRAKEESIETILEMAEYKNRGTCKFLVVAGCLPQRYLNELKEELPEVDLFVGTGEFSSIVKLLKERDRDRKLSRPEFSYREFTPRVNSQPTHRAYLKIAEGCSTACAYCVVPRLRGPAKSRPIDDVFIEAQRLVNRGAQELLVVAQNLTDYGLDVDQTLWLPKLLKKLDSLNCKWIRLHYLYPDNITDELIEVVANSEKICHYFDIPFQHINDEVLSRMNRRGTSRKQIENLISKLRKNIPDVSIRSTFIAGFPGETEGQFGELKDFLGTARLDHVGVFPYSKENGTRAERLDGHLPDEIRIARAEELMAFQKNISHDVLQKYVGKKIIAVVEGETSIDGIPFLIARSQYQAPEVDGTIMINDGTADLGEFVIVDIEQALDYDLVGGIVPFN
ncbi:30S ribosomal protein S12 methylthiotransferase RimO [Bdellovibrionota bacterium]